MFFRKYINKTVIVATKENRLGINIRKAYSTNPISKKSAETMLTKLLTINGSEVVSAINPLAIIKGNIIFSLDRKSTRLNSSHVASSYAVFCLKKKKRTNTNEKQTIDTK